MLISGDCAHPGELVVLPKGAPQGGYMLLARQQPTAAPTAAPAAGSAAGSAAASAAAPASAEHAAASASAAHGLFCAEQHYLFTKGVGGFLNLRKQESN